MKSPTGRLNTPILEMQSLPGTKEAEELRAKFRKAYPKLFAEFDFTRAELMALAAIRPPHKDIHVETAMQMFGVEAHQVTPAMRTAAKRRNFWDLYCRPTTWYQFMQEDSGHTD